jgi:hypothetical protein
VAAEPWDGDEQMQGAAQLVEPLRVPLHERIPLFVRELGGRDAAA